MSLLPKSFLINDAYATNLGAPIKPVAPLEPPKPPADDWTCAVASDNPPKPKATTYTPKAVFGAFGHFLPLVFSQNR